MKKAKINNEKYFTPSERLIYFLNKRLHLEKTKLEVKNGIRANLLPEEEKSEFNLRTEKNRILNDIVFPSMSNLTYFFQFIASNSELQKIFDDDIKDLLGLRRKNKKMKVGYMFEYLLTGMLEWDEHLDKKKYNFSPILFQIIGKAITYGLQPRFLKNYDLNIFKLFMQDIDRLGAWLASYTDNRSDFEDLDADPNRIFNDSVFDFK